MTFNLLIICLGLFMLSLLATYVGFAIVRQQVMQQRIFAVRDELWGKAALGGFLDDPAYVDFRRYVNMTINILPYMSIPKLVTLEKDYAAALLNRQKLHRESSDPAANQAIAGASEELTSLLYQYLVYWHPVSGIGLISIVKAVLLVLPHVSSVVGMFRSRSGQKSMVGAGFLASFADMRSRGVLGADMVNGVKRRVLDAFESLERGELLANASPLGKSH